MGNELLTPKLFQWKVYPLKRNIFPSISSLLLWEALGKAAGSLI